MPNREVGAWPAMAKGKSIAAQRKAMAGNKDHFGA